MMVGKDLLVFGSRIEVPLSGRIFAFLTSSDDGIVMRYSSLTTPKYFSLSINAMHGSIVRDELVGNKSVFFRFSSEIYKKIQMSNELKRTLHNTHIKQDVFSFVSDADEVSRPRENFWNVVELNVRCEFQKLVALPIVELQFTFYRHAHTNDECDLV